MRQLDVPYPVRAGVRRSHSPGVGNAEEEREESGQKGAAEQYPPGNREAQLRQGRLFPPGRRQPADRRARQEEAAGVGVLGVFLRGEVA